MLIAVFGAGQGSCWPAPHGRFPRWHHTGQPLEPSRSLMDFGRMRLAAALLTLVCLSACGGVTVSSMRRLAATTRGGSARWCWTPRRSSKAWRRHANVRSSWPARGAERGAARWSPRPTPRPLWHRLRKQQPRNSVGGNQPRFVIGLQSSGYPAAHIYRPIVGRDAQPPLASARTIPHRARGWLPRPFHHRGSVPPPNME